MPKNQKSTILWPIDINPENAEVFVSNTISTDKDIESLWSKLREAYNWHKWYPHANNVKIANHSSDKLENGSTFTWETHDMWVASIIDEYDEKEKRLAWRATLQGMTAYHAWIFNKDENNNTVIVTEECQTGPFARENKDMLTKAVFDTHQIWLEGLIS